MLAQTLDRLIRAVWAMEPTHLDAFVTTLLSLREADAAAGRQAVALEPNGARAIVSSEADEVATVYLRGPMATRIAPLLDLGLEATDAEVLAAEIRARADEGKKRIIISVDSPGGTVDSPAPIMQAIRYARAQGVTVEARIASGQMAASAAYWAILPVDRIVAEQRPGEAQPLVGSIGVYTVLVDISRALAERGVERILISSGGIKGAGADGRIPQELIREEQRLVDVFAGEFVDAVLTYRKVAVAPDGRLFGATEALAGGLIDEIDDAQPDDQRDDTDQEGSEAQADHSHPLDKGAKAGILTHGDIPMTAGPVKLDAYKALAAEFPDAAVEILSAVGTEPPEVLRSRLTEAKRAKELDALKAALEAASKRADEAEKRAVDLEAKLQAATNELAKLQASVAKAQAFTGAAPSDPGAAPSEAATVKHSDFRSWDAYKRAEWILKHGSRSVIMD